MVTYDQVIAAMERELGAAYKRIAVLEATLADLVVSEEPEAE